MATDIGPKIGIDGGEDFRRQLRQLNQEVKTFGSELKAAALAAEAGEDAEKSLTRQKEALEKQISSQAEKLALLQDRLKEAATAYGETDTATMKLAKDAADAEADLYKMSRDLKKVTDELDDFERDAKGAGRAMDDLGDESKDAARAADDLGDNLGGAAKDVKDFGDEAAGAAKDVGKGGLGGALDELKDLVGGGSLGSILTKGLGVTAVVGGVKELVGGMMDLVTETQEYRTIMASLENSSQRAGYTAEQTAETYRQLVGVLGDTQTAATATANLQALGLSQEELTTLTNAAVGAWATYGDSIPIDGLSESINETIQAGKVTGTFADVLNWAGTNEDEFNEKLEAANSSTERAQIVLDELARQGLADAGEAWRENNQDIVAVNEATAEWDDAIGELGATLAPVAAALTRFATSVLKGVISAIKEAVTWFNNLFTSANKATGLSADAAKSTKKTTSSSKTATSKTTSVNGRFATGLDYVPWDGFIAELHKGEMILTASEAKALRQRMQQGSGLTSLLRASGGSEVGGTAQTIQIVVQSVLDGKVLGETVTKVQAQMRRAGGMA